VVSNTQGGPRHDSKQSIVNPYGEPIPRLYEAGELGSIWGYLYLVGGNLAECFISGRIAGREAANLDPWDAK
jgi:predicted oxidoreductase